MRHGDPGLPREDLPELGELAGEQAAAGGRVRLGAFAAATAGILPRALASLPPRLQETRRIALARRQTHLRAEGRRPGPLDGATAQVAEALMAAFTNRSPAIDN